MSLFNHLSLFKDTRSYINQRHDLVDALFLVLAAVVFGQNGSGVSTPIYKGNSRIPAGITMKAKDSRGVFEHVTILNPPGM